MNRIVISSVNGVAKVPFIAECSRVQINILRFYKFVTSFLCLNTFLFFETCHFTGSGFRNIFENKANVRRKKGAIHGAFLFCLYTCTGKTLKIMPSRYLCRPNYNFMAIAFRIRIWIVLAFVLAGTLANAQNRRTSSDKRDKNEEKPGFVQRLWWGGSVGLGGSSFNGGSSFGLGLSPMLGYKITPFLSVGPRVEFFYTIFKPAANVRALNLFDFEAGAFLRGHVYRGFFVQGELSNSWQEVAFVNGSGYFKETVSRANQLIGLGYNFGRGEGGAASEIGIMYNLALANNLTTTELPIEYRFGFTWRF